MAGKSLSEPTLRRLLKRMGFSRKLEKKDCGGAGTGRVAKGRLEGDGIRRPRCSIFVFVDEMGTNTSLSPLYGWSKKGQRVHGSVPRNRGKNTTLLSSMTIEGMGPSLAVEGASTARVFETYVERVLGPTLCEGQVVVMDNLWAHKGERVRELIERRGCQLLYLPSYSADLNPSRRHSAR
jgi:hypothetical protein